MKSTDPFTQKRERERERGRDEILNEKERDGCIPF
jgi:hypothetical protein